MRTLSWFRCLTPAPTGINLRFTDHIRTGVWCDLCLNPAAVELDVVAIMDGAEPWVVGTASGCPDCQTGTFAGGLW